MRSRRILVELSHDVRRIFQLGRLVILVIYSIPLRRRLVGRSASGLNLIAIANSRVREEDITNCWCEYDCGVCKVILECRSFDWA